MTKVEGWHGLSDALDRGVIMRTHPSMNMDIYMYVDDPGVYFSAHGDVVADDLARTSGFDVDKQSREQSIKQAMKKAQEEVLAKFGENKSKVVAQRDGFKVVDLGLGRHNVMGPGGDLLTKSPVPLEQATILLDHLAPKPVEKSMVQQVDKTDSKKS
jgi:hypothetical protein